jgi:2-dehydropantoate 2-reductase
MRTTIVGPGAMGCLFAALLQEAGHEVWLLDHDVPRADAIERAGLAVEQDGRERCVAVRASADAARVPPCRVVWLFVKSPATRAALRGAAPLLAPETIVVSLQNGLGNAEEILRHVPAGRTVCGTTSWGAIAAEPGRVRVMGSGPSRVAPAAPEGMPAASEIADALRAAGVATEASPDLAGTLWSKLVLNAAINPLTALHEVANGALLEDTGLRRLLHDAVREAAAVAGALGIRLTYDDPARAANDLCRATGANASSMLQDIRRSRPTEIEALTGAVVREAARAGVPVPTNQMLLDRIRDKERKNR